MQSQTYWAKGDRDETRVRLDGVERIGVVRRHALSTDFPAVAAIPDQMRDRPPGGDRGSPPQSVGAASGEQDALPEASEAGQIRVGLIDSLRFSRDCLIRAFGALHPNLIIVPFASVEECAASKSSEVEIILYYCHDEGPFETLALQQVKLLRQKLDDIPIVVLSDARSALQPRSIRTTLNSGAQGIIPTLTTELPAALAAIRFVKEGGTFAPLNALLGGRQDRLPEAAESLQPNRLTPRQAMVLTHLRQGKANKIIAYELGMTESTVKVHVRNIMRKMGATNRTQAVYKAQQFGTYPDAAGLHE